MISDARNALHGPPAAPSETRPTRVLQAGMQNDILATLARRSDDEVAPRLKSLTGREREATAEIVAHLAEMDRRDIHLRDGYPRLYDYCRAVLHLSEWEAWNRIEAGRMARRFPILLDMLEDGSINITGIKLLGPHLTPENHRAVLAEARFKSKFTISEIVASLNPQPDVPTTIVPIPALAIVSHTSGDATTIIDATSDPGSRRSPAVASVIPGPPPAQRAVLTPLSPHRYKLEVTISDQTMEKLRRAKDMLAHAVAASDDDAILNRALTVLIDKLAREKFAQTDKPRPGRPRNRRARRPSAAVRRILWQRDGGRCKYISPDGHRCEETRRLEAHHLDPWALTGDVASADAYELRCQRHNDYEGRLYFGKRARGDGAGEVHERPAPYVTSSSRHEFVPEQISLSRTHSTL